MMITIESDDEMHRERKPVLQKDGEGSTWEVDKVAESLALISSHLKAKNSVIKFCLKLSKVLFALKR